MWIYGLHEVNSEAVFWKFSLKKVFLKISQYLQENIFSF